MWLEGVEAGIRLLGDPKDEPATADEEFRRPPEFLVIYNHSYFFKDL